MYTDFETLLKFLLLLVDYAQPEVDLVCLLKIGLHTHDLREGFLGVFQGAIAVIEYTNPVPQLRFLCRGQIRSHRQERLDVLHSVWEGSRGLVDRQCRPLADCPS